ncbi:DUF4124 domain-containing protein [Halomonas glaciei]|uniref:DUF4124 domain-containing protein n=2 Tax=Vreelandella glaciei TaxID=186761 RepID=A0A7Z0S0E8_9GAMM|nr:DUF4124 domain-containing protein [Halomonas glaciei]
MVRQITTFIMFSCLSSFAHAELYKCVANGHTTFQDFPCASGESSKVDTDNLTVIPPPPVRPPSQSSQLITPQPRRYFYFPHRSVYQTTLERRNARVRMRARLP